MNISLTPQLEAYVQSKLDSGLYTSASEVIREALRLLEQYERMRESRLETLQQEVLLGLSQLDSGRSKAFNKQAIKRIKASGRRKLNAARAKAK